MIGVRFPSLDKGFVELIDLMPHPASDVSPDFAVVQAARVSYANVTKGSERDARLLDYLMRNKHTSPFEQVRFKFRVKAPVVVYWHWARHRTFQFMSVNSISGRYVEFEEDEFYIPVEWRGQSESSKQGSDGVLTSSGDWHELYKTHVKQSYDLYKQAVSLGMAKEQARLFLPAWSSYYTWIVNVDLHNLFHFLKLRLDPTAQYEIREYAKVLATIVKKSAPICFDTFERNELGYVFECVELPKPPLPPPVLESLRTPKFKNGDLVRYVADSETEIRTVSHVSEQTPYSVSYCLFAEDGRLMPGWYDEGMLERVKP